MNNIISPLVIGLSVIIAAGLIGQSLSHTTTITTTNQNSISVNGDGQVFVKPDTFIIEVVAQEKTKTTEEWFKAVTQKIGSVQKLMKENGILDKDMQSINIGINPNYNYENGKTTIDWFNATHGLKIKIRNLESVDKILTGVSSISGIQIQNTTYDIDDKTEYYKEARNLAIAKAKQKAEEMAKATGISVGKVVSISESQNYATPYANQMMKSVMADSGTVGWTVSVGQMEVNTTVSINYEIN